MKVAAAYLEKEGPRKQQLTDRKRAIQLVQEAVGEWEMSRFHRALRLLYDEVNIDVILELNEKTRVSWLEQMVPEDEHTATNEG